MAQIACVGIVFNRMVFWKGYILFVSRILPKVNFVLRGCVLVTTNWYNGFSVPFLTLCKLCLVGLSMVTATDCFEGCGDLLMDYQYSQSLKMVENITIPHISKILWPRWWHCCSYTSFHEAWLQGLQLETGLTCQRHSWQYLEEVH